MMSMLLIETFTSVRRSYPAQAVSREFERSLTACKDHCVDDIRQALMCHADTSAVTFDWKPQYRRPWPNFSVDHTCVNWEALDDWASERSFSAFDQKSLVHPEFGGGSRRFTRLYEPHKLTQGLHFRSRIPYDRWTHRGSFAWARHAHRVATRSFVEKVSADESRGSICQAVGVGGGGDLTFRHDCTLART